MLALLVQRLWLVVLLAVLAGVSAWALTRGGTETYEREVVFVLRPSAQVRDVQIPDAVRGIASQDSQLVHTVSRVIETDRFLEQAFDDAFDREPIEGYTLSSSLVPGSDLIEVALQGPDEAVLDGLAEAYTDEAPDWVRDVYRAYSLDLLEIRAPDGPVSMDPRQTIAFAALLGLLLGVGVVFAERKARERMAEPPPVELIEPVEPEPARVRRVDRSGRASSAVELSGRQRPEERPRQRPRRS